MNIVDFIEARLDEDEQIARIGSIEFEGEPWVASGEVVLSDHEWNGSRVAERVKYDRTASSHIARHDPARVLREVLAKRRILSLALVRTNNDETDPIVLFLAEPWHNHPDHQPEWLL
jgi:hypothetical protein